MPERAADEKNFLNMAGEFLVAAELNRRHILCAVTYGTAKCADVWAFAKSGNQAARIEVKTTGSQRWVIGEKPLHRDMLSECPGCKSCHLLDKTALHPDESLDVFWVLVHLPNPQPPHSSEDDSERGRHAPQFFVLNSEEIQKQIIKDCQLFQEAYRIRNGCDFTGKGVVTLNLESVKGYENGWDKIEQLVNHLAPKTR